VFAQKIVGDGASIDPIDAVLAESLKKMHKETCDTPNDEP
jgi:hypothetical protein